jgi:DNA-binding transcriptional LysR family regulator
VSEPAFPQPADGRRATLGLLAVSELKIIQGLASGKTQVEIGGDVHLEQSTISRMLKHAEERVGFAIVETSGRRLQLTAAGGELANAAQRVVSAFDELDDFVRALRRGEAGTVRFVTSSTPGSYVLPAIVAEFLRGHPNVSVDMRIMPISTLWQAFEAEQFEFAVAPIMGLPKELASEPLYDDPVVFFAAPELPIADKASVTLEDLAGETLIGKFVDSHWRRIFRELEESGFRAKRRVTIIPPEAVKRMVAQRIGIGVLFESSVRRELADGVFKRVRLEIPALQESFCIAANPASGVLSPAADALLAHLRSRFTYVPAE